LNNFRRRYRRFKCSANNRKVAPRSRVLTSSPVPVPRSPLTAPAGVIRVIFAARAPRAPLEGTGEAVHRDERHEHHEDHRQPVVDKELS